MAVRQEYIDLMVRIPGFSVSKVDVHEGADGEKRLLIELWRREAVYRCGCGREFTSYYDCEERCVRDLPYGPYRRSYLFFFQVRVECPDCGVVTERLDWVLPRVEYSQRLAAAVALSCREIRSLKAVGEQYGLHEKTVKRIDKAALEDELPSPGDSNPRLMGVDEFATKKGYCYGTTVMDFERRSIPYIGRDRTKESLAGYYRLLGPAKCSEIAAVAMDLWPAYEEATRQYCPGAEIVYDPFHLISAYGREVVDRVRIDEYRRAQGEMKEVIKGSKYLLLKNAENLNDSRGERARLGDLLRLNRNLFKVYVLKDDLRTLWSYRSEGWLRKRFRSWYRRAMRSGIEPLRRFAVKLKSHFAGILAHCRYPINTSFIEGVNNKIKVIKRVAFGFRDLDYFFLKVRGAFRPEVTHT